MKRLLSTFSILSLTMMTQALAENTYFAKGSESPVQNGTALVSILKYVEAKASAAKPVIVELSSGVYDLGFRRLHLKPHVILRGTNKDAVKIISSYGHPWNGMPLVYGAIHLDSNASVENVSIKIEKMRVQTISTNGNMTQNVQAALSAKNATSVKIKDVNVEFSRDITSRAFGFYGAETTAELEKVTFVSPGTGIYGAYSQIKVQNSKVDAQTAVASIGTVYEIKDCELNAFDAALRLNGLTQEPSRVLNSRLNHKVHTLPIVELNSYASLKISYSEVNGRVQNGEGTMGLCYYSHGDLSLLDISCDEL